MRKLVTWVLVTLGIAALVRKLRRRSQADRSERYLPEAGAPAASVAESTAGVQEPGFSVSTEEDPADELRRKLADTRDEESTPEESTPEESTHEGSTPGSGAGPEATIEERRNEVHEQGRAAIDDMQRSTED